ncbi:hypothetical protein ACLB2K_052667 [Fragaria x ananassa]
MQDLIEEIFPEDPNENAQRFYKLLEEAETPLYKGCRKYFNLSFLVKLMHIKCSGAWSNDSFGMLLRLLKDAFPMCRKLPSRNYGAKKIVKELGLHYERIDACKNDCIIYYKKYKNRTVCPKCKTPRWKTQGGKGDKKNKKKIPWKVLRYFPLTPRLQRLFMSSKTASIMRWHSEEHVKDGELRHPADSEAWKHFDQTHESFNVDSRNTDPKIPLQIMQDDKQNPSNREEHETDEPRSESQPSNASGVSGKHYSSGPVTPEIFKDASPIFLFHIITKQIVLEITTTAKGINLVVRHSKQMWDMTMFFSSDWRQGSSDDTETESRIEDVRVRSKAIDQTVFAGSKMLSVSKLTKGRAAPT